MTAVTYTPKGYWIWQTEEQYKKVCSLRLPGRPLGSKNKKKSLPRHKNNEARMKYGR
jgi:hypothetical protein